MVAGVALAAAASLAVGGCGSGSNSSAPGCFTKAAGAGQASTAGSPAGPGAAGGTGAVGGTGAPGRPAGPAAAAGWTLPGGNLQNTRDVASAINSSNVSKLGVAWTVPIEAAFGRYATTPVVVNGVVYTQDLESNVMAIELATGQILWRHTYNSPNGGPDGVNVANGTVYAATNHAAVALSAATGWQLWSLPVGVHNGHDRDGLLTENARPTSHLPLPALFCLEPGGFGGIESQLATNGTTTFAAVNNLPMPMTRTVPGYSEPSSAALIAALARATGEMVAVDQDTGKIEWADRLPSSPYAAAVTNNVVFTTTYGGDLYAFNAATGAVLLKKQLPARTNAPVTVDGDYVITAGSVAQTPGQRMFIVAYKLGARGKLPGAVNS
jgi:hypothetical protein